jgi:hypothetical protein
MAMRKKRHVEIGPVQQLKVQLLEHVEAADPDPPDFTATLAEAVIAVSHGPGTGPAQAVASYLEMDWHMSCHSPGFFTWLRTAAASRNPLLSGREANDVGGVPSACHKRGPGRGALGSRPQATTAHHLRHCPQAGSGPQATTAKPTFRVNCPNG